MIFLDLKNLFDDIDLSNRELTILNITQKMTKEIAENAVATECLSMNSFESELEQIQLSTTVAFLKITKI